jgi:hypothetical protein
MQLEHVNVKLFLQHPEQVELDPLIPVFHSWIQGQVFRDLLLDVADYRHVPAGPGVVLIGHEGNYSVDNTDSLLGVRYNRKAPLEGSNQDRLRQAAGAALAACARLETEPRLAGKLRFDGERMQIFFNDRLLAANCAATREAAWPELEQFLHTLFRGGGYSLTNGGEPRRLFSVSVKAPRVFPVAELLGNLDSAPSA